jgi:hypothetical protein
MAWVSPPFNEGLIRPWAPGRKLTEDQGVGVGDEGIAGAGGDQLIYDGAKGVLFRFVAQVVWLPREDDSFRNTDACEGIGC